MTTKLWSTYFYNALFAREDQYDVTEQEAIRFVAECAAIYRKQGKAIHDVTTYGFKFSDNAGYCASQHK